MPFATTFTTPSIAAIATSSSSLVLLSSSIFLLTTHRKKLRNGFYLSAMQTLIPVVLCFSLALIGYILLMDLSSCLVLKKIVYSLIYINFLNYDFYQLQKVLQLTSCTGYKSWFLYLALGARLVTVVLTTYYAKGLIPNATVDGLGSCLTSIPREIVVLEHIISIGFELALIVHFGVCFLIKYLNKEPVSEFLSTAIDFESFTFLIYFFTEVVYLIAFHILPSSYISTMNLIYNSLPGMLFLANGIVQMKWARKEQSTVENKFKKNKKTEKSDKVIGTGVEDN
ncbi:hypothetical protein HDV02_004944 [Globomyces sp. JEL0801]|nr:hypothetical protein HDV02_004944 [Globomyces sp. JEL0801]